MWNSTSKCGSGNCSDDEASSNCGSNQEGLECPICWESFNIVENIPYVLWCGHTLCKNCILALQWAVVKCPTLPIQLPLFISCPWCNLLSPRVIYKQNLKFPRKNYFLLWMLESMNGDRLKSHTSLSNDDQITWPSNKISSSLNVQERSRTIHDRDYIVERVQSLIQRLFLFFFHLTAKFPLVIIFLLIILYAIPASAVVLALYIVITLLFALPSFLLLYFAYPSLDWLVREIIA